MGGLGERVELAPIRGRDFELSFDYSATIGKADECQALFYFHRELSKLFKAPPFHQWNLRVVIYGQRVNVGGRSQQLWRNAFRLTHNLER